MQSWWTGSAWGREGPLLFHYLSLLSRERMPGRNNYKKEETKTRTVSVKCFSFFCMRSGTNESREITYKRHSLMTTLHHRFSGVFPNWNLPSVFHSCLLQMDIRFRENTLFWFILEGISSVPTLIHLQDVNCVSNLKGELHILRGIVVIDRWKQERKGEMASVAIKT